MRRLSAPLLGALLGALPVLAANPAVNILTNRYNNARTGANTQEPTLTAANVSSAGFGALFSLAVNGSVYAQPLYVSGVAIPGQGVHNVLYVCTMADSVYAFDADSNTGANATPLWRLDLRVVPNSFKQHHIGIGDHFAISLRHVRA